MADVNLGHIEVAALEIVDASRDRDITKEEAERTIKRVLQLAYDLGKHNALHRFRRL